MQAFSQQAPYDSDQTDLVPPSGDALGDALTCRSDSAHLWSLLPRLRRERPDEFAQAYRQYSQPMMDLYQLQAPVQAWGNIGDAVAVTQNRMMLAVRGSMEEVSARIDRELEASRESPLPGVLDNAHALVVYPAELPGLEGMVLLGCEYRIEGLSLLDDPEDAWRRYTPPLPSDDPRPPPQPAATAPARPAAPPATPSDTTATAPAKPAATGYAVQVGAFANATQATALRDRLRALGFSAFIEQVNTDKGVLTRVRAGPVATREAADQLKSQVAAKTGIGGQVRPHP